jgi:hypothetical protein
MYDVALHFSMDHPNLAWIAVSSLLSFGVGVLAGARSERLRERFGTTRAEHEPR